MIRSQYPLVILTETDVRSSLADCIAHQNFKNRADRDLNLHGLLVVHVSIIARIAAGGFALRRILREGLDVSKCWSDNSANKS